MYPFCIVDRPMHIFLLLSFCPSLWKLMLCLQVFFDNLLVRVWVAIYKFGLILYTADNPFFFDTIDGGHCSGMVSFILFYDVDVFNLYSMQVISGSCSSGHLSELLNTFIERNQILDELAHNIQSSWHEWKHLWWSLQNRQSSLHLWTDCYIYDEESAQQALTTNYFSGLWIFLTLL